MRSAEQAGPDHTWNTLCVRSIRTRNVKMTRASHGQVIHSRCRNWRKLLLVDRACGLKSRANIEWNRCAITAGIAGHGEQPVHMIFFTLNLILLSSTAVH
jgi:hypothetical protein